VRNIIHISYHKTIILFNKLRWVISGVKVTNPKDIPIIINNYNRLEYLKMLIDSLTSRGYNNIHILDNNSTYPPLLEYYKNCSFSVIPLDKNFGYKALWKSGVFDKFKHSYYVYTDSDMEISAECPDDFMLHFLDILKRYPLSQKVGFGLRIDDLPDHFANKESVIKHESQFWTKEIEHGVYRADIDTTFALYRPYCKGVASKYQEVYRTGVPYLIRHLPWYVNTNNMSDEELYYVNNITQSTHWSIKSKK
jgi:glycosyltransferase involved in cell wall biosynthesis